MVADGIADPLAQDDPMNHIIMRYNWILVIYNWGNCLVYRRNA
jgi:hypothetical protein